MEYTGGFRRALKGYRDWARRRGDVWALTDGEVRELFSQACRYCEAPPANRMRRGKPSEFLYQGMDRVEPKLGYVAGNVVPCCKTCNWAKQLMGLEEFRAWVARVHHNFAYRAFADSLIAGTTT